MIGCEMKFIHHSGEGDVNSTVDVPWRLLHTTSCKCGSERVTLFLSDQILFFNVHLQYE